jgi:carboxyl-terminal processing protease
LLLGGLGGASLGSALAAPPKSTEPATDEPKAAIRPEVEPVGSPPNDYSRFRKLDRFARALAIIEQYYVRPVDGEELIDAALDGLVQTSIRTPSICRPATRSCCSRIPRAASAGSGWS